MDKWCLGKYEGLENPYQVDQNRYFLKSPELDVMIIISY